MKLERMEFTYRGHTYISELYGGFPLGVEDAETGETVEDAEIYDYACDEAIQRRALEIDFTYDSMRDGL